MDIMDTLIRSNSDGLDMANLDVQQAQQQERNRTSSTLQYLSKSSFETKEVPLEAFSIENHHVFDSTATMQDGVSETALVALPKTKRLADHPDEIRASGEDKKLLDYHKLNQLLHELQQSVSNFKAFRKNIRDIATTCRLTSDQHRIDANVWDEDERRLLGIKIFLLISLYYAVPAILVYSIPLQFPLYRTTGELFPSAGFKPDCASKTLPKRIEVKSSGDWRFFPASLGILGAHIVLYVIYRSACTSKHRRLHIGSYVASVALLTSFAVCFGLYTNMWKNEAPIFTMHRFALLFFLVIMSFSSLLLALRGWTGKLNYLKGITILFNIAHNLTILLALIISLLLYLEIMEQRRPCGYGRPLTKNSLQEVLKAFAIVAALVLIFSFMLTREVQMFLKGLRTDISKDDAFKGATVVTFSFLYPDYIWRLCCRKRISKPRKIGPNTTKLPSQYCKFAEETDVMLGSDDIYERKMAEARKKAEEAARKAEEARKLAEEARILADEARGIALADG